MDVQIHIQRQLAGNAMIALADAIKRLADILSGRRQTIAFIKEIRHLDIGGAALARRARHHDAAIRIHKQNLLDLPELLSTGQGASAKFRNFDSHSDTLRFFFIQNDTIL